VTPDLHVTRVWVSASQMRLSRRQGAHCRGYQLVNLSARQRQATDLTQYPGSLRHLVGKVLWLTGCCQLRWLWTPGTPWQWNL